MGDDDHEVVVVAFVLIVIASIVAAVVGHGCGFDSGVRAHAAGTHVVHQLPDGTSVVVKAKVKGGQ